MKYGWLLDQMTVTIWYMLVEYGFASLSFEEKQINSTI